MNNTEEDMEGSIKTAMHRSLSFESAIRKSTTTPNINRGDENDDDDGARSKSSINLHINTPLVPIGRTGSSNGNSSFIDMYVDECASKATSSPMTVRRQSVIPGPQSFDRYGFKKQNNYVSEEEYDKWWSEYSQYCVRRKHKWQLLLTKSGLPLNDDSPEKFPPQSEKLKRYVRKGIPAEWRGKAWWYFARGDEKLSKNKGVYDNLLSKIEILKKQKSRKSEFLRDLDIIERDLNRTFPDNIHFHRESFQKEEPSMIKALRRVLLAFSIYDTNIGYCQSMNFLAGLLLLFMDEEKAFWMLVIITKKYLPGVHSVNLEGVNIDQGVLILCVKEYLPELWAQMEASFINYNRLPCDDISGSSPTVTPAEILNKLPPITLSTASWFMSCFVGVVPIETTLRIWDCLFYEKSHFLFKASLAILKLSENEILQKKQSQGIFASLNMGGGSNESFLFGSNKDTSNSNTHHKPTQEDNDMWLFQVIQTFPKKLINPNDIFDKVIFKKKNALNKITQEEIDSRRKYVTAQRQKYRHFNDVLNESTSSDIGLNQLNKNSTPSIRLLKKDQSMSNEFVNDTLSSEVNGFKNISLSGASWNNSIKERVWNMRQKK